MHFIHSYLQYIQDNPLPVGGMALALYAIFRTVSFLTGTVKSILGILCTMLLYWVVGA